MATKTIFINYRRDDTAPYALAIRAEFERHLKGMTVFIDTQGIEALSQWPAVLQEALSQADAFLCLIGPGWLGASAPDGQLRLFDPEDWVRREIVFALKHIPQLVVPVLVGTATMPSAGELPTEMKALAEIQAFRLTGQRWDREIGDVCDTFCSRLGFERREDVFQYTPVDDFNATMPSVSAERLGQALAMRQLDGWRAEGTDDPRYPLRMWLTKKFQFKGFTAAMEFMNEAGVFCESIQHHPRWENVYGEVLVRLSKFNAGHKITEDDLKVAVEMNKIATKVSRT